MFEFEVKTKSGNTIYVLAAKWENKSGTIYFYQHSKVVKQFPSHMVQSIQQTYPDRKEAVIIE